MTSTSGLSDAALIGSVSISVLAGLVVCAFFVILAIRWKKKKRDAEKQEADVDENPVYGIYYTSAGDKVDQGRSEVVDDNDYYAIS